MISIEVSAFQIVECLENVRKTQVIVSKNFSNALVIFVIPITLEH